MRLLAVSRDTMDSIIYPRPALCNYAVHMDKAYITVLYTLITFLAEDENLFDDAINNERLPELLTEEVYYIHLTIQLAFHDHNLT